MPDREKVIKALETEIMNFTTACTSDERLKETMEMALELLKEQEPRVLTLEEAKKADVCWLEQRGYEPYVTDDADTWNPEIYGEVYRCWSLKPTDEQRKAAKWG